MTVVALWGQELHPLRHRQVMMRTWGRFGSTVGSVLKGHWWQRGDMECVGGTWGQEMRPLEQSVVTERM